MKTKELLGLLIVAALVVSVVSISGCVGQSSAQNQTGTGLDLNLSENDFVLSNSPSVNVTNSDLPVPDNMQP